MSGEQQESSDDSDFDLRIKNVSRLVIRPDGHSGKAKKGHLVFDAAFESGNLGRVDRISDFEYDLFVRPDITHPGYRFWFYFSIENPFKNQRIKLRKTPEKSDFRHQTVFYNEWKVILNMVNLVKFCPLFHEGFGPIVRSSRRTQWNRIPSENVFYYRSPEHRMRYVLSFAFVFDSEEDNDVYQFALCYPYSYSKYCTQLQIWKEFANKPTAGLAQDIMFEVNVIGKSLQNREIHLIKIGCNEWQKTNKCRPKVVVIMSRIHPSETPSSYVCEGIINLLVSRHPVSNCLRRFATFYIIPVLNPDGVFVGNTRTSVIGSDLNQSWHKSSPLMYPELEATKQGVFRITQTLGDDLDIYMDIHAHTHMFGSCMYAVSKDNMFLMERLALLPKLLGLIANDFYIDNTVYCKETLRSGSSRSYMASILPNHTNCYTLEVSHYGYYDKPSLGHTIIPYTQSKYKQLGENVVIAILDSYLTIGHISIAEIPQEVLPLLSHSSDGILSHLDPYKLKDPNKIQKSETNNRNK